jgi:hypothetical protein
MSFEPRDYLRHIVVEADYVIGQSVGLSFDVFSADETLRRASSGASRSSAKLRRGSHRSSGHNTLKSIGARWLACGTG